MYDTTLAAFCWLFVLELLLFIQVCFQNIIIINTSNNICGIKGCYILRQVQTQKLYITSKFSITNITKRNLYAYFYTSKAIARAVAQSSCKLEMVCVREAFCLQTWAKSSAVDMWPLVADCNKCRLWPDKPLRSRSSSQRGRETVNLRCTFSF